MSCRVLHVHGISSFSVMVLIVPRGALPRLTGHCLAPDGLNSRAPMPACPPHQGETSATIWDVGSRHVTPSPQNTTKGGVCWVMGHMQSYPPPRAITRRRIRRQSTRRDASNLEERTPQLTPTDPSRTIYPRQPGTPVEPERNHTTSR